MASNNKVYNHLASMRMDCLRKQSNNYIINFKHRKIQYLTKRKLKSPVFSKFQDHPNYHIMFF